VTRHSLFSQRLDRGVFVAYFVGGIGPVAAFTWLVQHYVLPFHVVDDSARAGWIAACISLGVLSLALFLALRVITRRAVARMSDDNRRLSVMLKASRELATETHTETTLGRAADHVAALLPGVEVGILFSREPEKPLDLLLQRGALGAGWWEQNLEELRAVASEGTSGHQERRGVKMHRHPTDMPAPDLLDSRDVSLHHYIVVRRLVLKKSNRRVNRL
jgi:hypothetical protein